MTGLEIPCEESQGVFNICRYEKCFQAEGCFQFSASSVSRDGFVHVMVSSYCLCSRKLRGNSQCFHLWKLHFMVKQEISPCVTVV